MTNNCDYCGNNPCSDVNCVHCGAPVNSSDDVGSIIFLSGLRDLYQKQKQKEKEILKEEQEEEGGVN